MALRRFFSGVKPLLEEKLKCFDPNYLEVIDESWMHQVGKETHFKVMVVSDQFEGMKTFNRELKVAKEIKEAWQKSVVTMSIVAQTPSEYEKYKSNTIIFEYPVQGKT